MYVHFYLGENIATPPLMQKTLKIEKILQISQFLSQTSLQKIISGMAPSTNILQTYLESPESTLL